MRYGKIVEVWKDQNSLDSTNRSTPASDPELLRVTFHIPTLNAGQHLASCLRSIRKQEYPQDLIEILVADGGSVDRTVSIARNEGAKVFDNPRKLADYGVKINAANARGDLFVAFAADNELVSDNWVRVVTRIFQEHKDLAALWCDMTVSEHDAPINGYYDLIKSDPLTFFLNKNLDWYLRQAEAHQVDGTRYYTFEMRADRPLVWGANGLTYRFRIVRDFILSPVFVGDNDVFQQVIESGHRKVAFVPDLRVYHHHLTSLGHWISKWRRNYSQHFIAQLNTRNMNWIKVENFRLMVVAWFVLSLTPPITGIQSMLLAFRDRDKNWLYHPMTSFAQAFALLHMVISSREGRNMTASLFRQARFSDGKVGASRNPT